jgi:hypothetical protein
VLRADGRVGELRVILPFQAPAVRAQKSFVRMIRLSDFAGKDIVPPF